MSGPLVDDFARRLVTLRLIQLIQHQKTSFSRKPCVLIHPLLDDFCTTTRHFMSNSTVQDVFFLDKFAQ